MEERRLNYAAMKDVQTKQERGECAKSMVQRENTNDAALKDVQINPNEEELFRRHGSFRNHHEETTAKAFPSHVGSEFDIRLFGSS